MNDLQETTLFLPENEQGKSGKKRGRLTGSLAAKVTAYILLVLMVMVTAGGVLGAAVIADQNLYTISKETYKYDQFEGIARRDGMRIASEVLAGNSKGAERYCAERNVGEASIYKEDGTKIWIWRSGQAVSDQWSFSDITQSWNGDSAYPKAFYQVRVTLTAGLPVDDTYAMADKLIDLAYALRYWIYAIIAVAAVLSVVCFVFLLCASGHHTGEEGVRPGWGTRLPLDVLTIGGFLGSFFLMELVIEEVMYQTSSDLLTLLLLAACGVYAVIVFTGWCMSLALRIKLGSWWKNTVVWWILLLAVRVCKKLRHGLGVLGSGAAALLRGIPMVWKTAAVFAGISLLEFLLILMCWWETDVLLVLWLLEKLVLFGVVLYCAIVLRKLQKGGEALASGDLGYHVDTRRMFWDFRRHGEDLNSIAQGMTRAVDQRMKSERLKTELITNVSHDIKTPLTSIINYADLIGREPCDNEKITEYAGVLLRQSERLKKLIEDLVEASKASTGNLEVLLAPCEAGVLLTQAAGEYEQRLEAANLELVTRQPDHPVTILADGRRLWRVFDNLMSNICKYAQGGTRVYLTLEEQDGQAVISFKNTSRSPLDISADELMERFVRGDASRNTEGNGLGLSIARSLTDLQKGTMDLTVDGDLFKVVLRFPLVV